MSRHRTNSSSSSDSLRPSTYSNVLTYRFAEAELQLYCPSLQLPQSNAGSGRPIAVFGQHDYVGGKVVLDRACQHSGNLSISVEGTITYSPDHVDGNIMAACPEDLRRKHHTFFSTYTVVPVVTPTRPLTRIPSGASSRKGFQRRPRPPNIDPGAPASVSECSFPFGFELPPKHAAGEGLPPSFVGTADPGPSCEILEIGYKVRVIWETLERPVLWEVPILIHRDAEAQSVHLAESQEWLEMPLRSDRPIPFRSAITLPASVTFSRASYIPYFVVFATKPQFSELAKEIAADTTISVSLVRQVNVLEHASPPPTPPDTPTSSPIEESDTSLSKFFKRGFRTKHSRVPSGVGRAAKILEESDESNKPLPHLPIQTLFSQSRVLENNICIGFPKRPRRRGHASGHPSIDFQNVLPDGLLKSKISLHEGMPPCINWAGVSIKYYLDVSVLLAQDDLRARIPVKII